MIVLQFTYPSHPNLSLSLSLPTLSLLSSEKRSTMMATTMLRPRVVIIMKNSKSNILLAQYIVKDGSSWPVYLIGSICTDIENDNNSELNTLNHKYSRH